jgi:hypothetical protein
MCTGAVRPSACARRCRERPGTPFHAGRARIILDVRGFPPKTGVGLDWINNQVRGYLVAAFTTDAAGSYAGTALTFRPGEVRGIAIKFERSDGADLPGIGKPC